MRNPKFFVVAILLVAMAALVGCVDLNQTQSGAGQVNIEGVPGTYTWTWTPDAQFEEPQQPEEPQAQVDAEAVTAASVPVQQPKIVCPTRDGHASVGQVIEIAEGCVGWTTSDPANWTGNDIAVGWNEGRGLTVAVLGPGYMRLDSLSSDSNPYYIVADESMKIDEHDFWRRTDDKPASFYIANGALVPVENFAQ